MTTLPTAGGPLKRRLTIEEFNGGFQTRPATALRLKGHWLRLAGFPAGAQVEVEILAHGVLAVSVVRPEEPL